MEDIIITRRSKPVAKLVSARRAGVDVDPAPATSDASTSIAAQAVVSILREHPMLDSVAVRRVVGGEETTSLWGRGGIVGLPVGNVILYPAFQFDTADHRVRPIVAKINQLLGAQDDPWGVASWWLSPTGFSDDPRSPAELAVSGDCDDELRAMARDLIAD
ncbi:hypothetical protein [Jongsikchunia kroppenstedtii]|uniref:hypothetical protein n=1 Tax=Jongsikchunia kroppenstedtii TaxID=1121721 RepID=UPI0003AA128C